MAKNYAICIGINNYDNMPNLQYAQRDAELMRNYFFNEAGFENVYLFTDNSPPINDADKPFNSQPTYGTLKRFLRERFDKEFLSPGDNFWFFYSGHGMRFNDRDYLMPADADPHPDGVEETAIPLYFVTERLRRCGADNVI
ncbi:MAG: caspase family protein [Okeania sp. SIO3H1]|nr:caspase family protein [Okeania sp. SIO3H1]